MKKCLPSRLFVTHVDYGFGVLNVTILIILISVLCNCVYLNFRALLCDLVKVVRDGSSANCTRISTVPFAMSWLAVACWEKKIA